jgi:hypothetical protein
MGRKYSLPHHVSTDPTNPTVFFAASGSSLTAVEGGVYYSI